MARTNYSYEKRSRELEKQKKKEDKRLKKLAEKNEKADGEALAPSEVEANTTPPKSEEEPSQA